MNDSPEVATDLKDGALTVNVSGRWNIDADWPPKASETLEKMPDVAAKSLKITAKNLGAWDSSLLVFLYEILKIVRKRKIPVVLDLPAGLANLTRMAFAVPPRQGADRKASKLDFFARVGRSALGLGSRVCDFLNFLGATTQGVGRLFIGKSKMRGADLFKAMAECGAESLPIISLTSLLFGLILAFVGAVQLKQFGAQIYVAGLVGIGMLRVMGAVMVGVVMAGRIGAAYAALIGTMRVNEEIDALEVVGVSPIDFLVTPRVLALTLMTPLLTLYADLMGMIGGWLVATQMLDINSLQYMIATVNMVRFKQALVGLVYGTVFGVVIAVASCYQGIRCGRSAMAVGQTTTKAVVASIVGIIVMSAIITVICNYLGV